jgi:hypothetical protein
MSDELAELRAEVERLQTRVDVLELTLRTIRGHAGEAEWKPSQARRVLAAVEQVAAVMLAPAAPRST